MKKNQRGTHMDYMKEITTLLNQMNESDLKIVYIFIRNVLSTGE